MAADRYGCATRRTKGTCANSATILRREIEAPVLAGLKEKLMAPELVATFVEEFQAQVNQAARDAEQRLAALRREAKAIESKIAGLLKAIEDGMYTPAMKDRMAALETRRNELERELRSAMPAPPLRLHPGLSKIYRLKVAQLEAALNDDSIKAEAAEVLRALDRARSACGRRRAGRPPLRRAGGDPGVLRRGRTQRETPRCLRASGESSFGGCGGPQPLIPNNSELAVPACNQF